MKKSVSNIILNNSSIVWSMLKLNKIMYQNTNFNLVAIGFSDGKIEIFNLSKMETHQEIKTTSKVYSLTQFKDDSKYLICSLSEGKLQIYILKANKYVHFQTLKKPNDIDRGEINKVITLSNGNLGTAEREAISIWRLITEKGEKKFEFFKEIITGYDTCHLIEVNPKILACAIYDNKSINVYQKNGDDYLLYGQITHAESHGENSNCMAKIKETLFCSGGNHFIYIVSVEPVQIIKTINLAEKFNENVQFLHNSNDGFIFSFICDKIIQLEIINDEKGNFISLEIFDEIYTGEKNKAITTTDDGKIFYKKKLETSYEKSLFILSKYKNNEIIEFKSKLNKHINF